MTSSTLYHIFGIDVNKRNNVLLYGYDEIIYIAGKSIVKFNTNTKQRTYLYKSTSNESPNCLAVDKDNVRLFVGTCGAQSPSIYQFTLPQLTFQKSFNGGAEKGYACMDVSPDEKRLCSVSTKPDFVMVIWDIATKQMLLSAKAFGQDIYHVSFSPFRHDCITTCGTGHIRFWNITNTFTGPKLEGTIGKFGKIDLTDVECFLHLPENNNHNCSILSSSESGHLLLWEDNFLKCRFVLLTHDDDLMKTKNKSTGSDEDAPIHQGGVYDLCLDSRNNLVISAGADGYLKWWSMQSFEISDDDLDENRVNVPICPLKVYNSQSIRGVRRIAPLVTTFDQFVITDLQGNIWRSPSSLTTDYDNKNQDITKLCDFHGSPLIGFRVSPKDHMIITYSQDGCMKYWDVLRKILLGTRFFKHFCSTIEWVPQKFDNTNRSIIAGFQDGSIRLLYIKEDTFILRQYFKPHNDEVLSIKFHPDSNHIATMSRDQTIFIFSLEKSCHIAPIGFFPLEEKVDCFHWKSRQPVVVIRYKMPKGTDIEVSFPNGLSSSDGIDNVRTYLLETEQKQIQQGKESIAASSLIVDDTTFANFHGVHSRLIGSNATFDSSFIISCCENGVISVQRIENGGSVEDGNLNKLPIEGDMFQMIKGGIEGDTKQPEGFSPIREIIQNTIVDDWSENLPCDQITESLQEERLKMIQNAETVASQKRKNVVRRNVENIRKAYLDVLQKNDSLPIDLRLSTDDTFVDHESINYLKNMEESAFINVREERADQIDEVHSLMKKFETIFVDPYEDHLYCVASFSNHFKVNSIPSMKISPTFMNLQKKINNILATRSNHETSTMIESQEASKSIECEDSNETSNSLNVPESDYPMNDRKALRELRKQNFEQKLNEKPDIEHDDPEDLKKIDEAENTIGNFVLKNSLDLVSYDKQLGSVDKIAELLKVEQSNNEIKKNFNSRLMKIKKSRDVLVNTISTRKMRIQEINEALNISEASETQTYKLFEIDTSCAENCTIGDMTDETAHENEDIVDDENVPSDEVSRNDIRYIVPVLATSSDHSVPSRLSRTEHLSDIHNDELKENQIKMSYERSCLLRQVEEEREKFEEELQNLRCDAFRSTIKIKLGELQQIRLLEEIKVLKKLESNDLDLRKSLESLMIEKGQVRRTRSYKLNKKLVP